MATDRGLPGADPWPIRDGHMLDADYLSAWYPKRAAERRAILERVREPSPFWPGTPGPA
jgi:hypothetical protein